jgi:hypothetical protein
MIRCLLAAVLCACPAIQIHAQSPAVPLSTSLSEPPSATNTVVVIRAGDLGDQAVVLEINGSKVAELKSSQSYTGVYSPGRLRFTFAETTMDTYAIANEEHVYELQIAAPKGHALVLKERKTTIAGLATQETKAAPPEAIAAQVSDAPSHANVRIVLVGAGDRSFPVAINGRAIGAIGPNSNFSAIYTPGRIDIVASGPRFEAKARIVSRPNEEYVFEVSSPPTPTRYKFGFFGFRELPDMIKGPDPTVTLKRRGLQFDPPAPQQADAPPAPAQAKQVD